MRERILRFSTVTIAVVFATIILTAFVACKENNDPDSSQMIGNPDAETLGFGSHTVQMDLGNDGHIIDIAKDGNNCYVLSCSRTSESEEYQYRVTTLDVTSYEKASEVVVPNEVDDHLFSLCALDNNKVACSYSGGYCIIDAGNGSLVYTGSVQGYDIEYPIVSKCEQGFILADIGFVAKITDEGELTGVIRKDDDHYPIDKDPVFTQNGTDYLVTWDDTANGTVYYKLDFDNSTLEIIADFDAFGIQPASFQGEYISDYDGVIYELDIENNKAETVAYGKNFLIKPSLGSVTDDRVVLDKMLFVQSYSYGNGFVDLVFIEADKDLDLASRKQIRVMGDFSLYDNGLEMAAYQYNASQNEYYVTVESWGNDSGYNSSVEAEARNLKLLKQFQSGEAPDIFYGNTFDYEYLGKTGITIDMMPFIEQSSVINRDNLRDSVYDIMTSNGHCYYLFNGYAISGMFCDASLTSNKSKDISLYEDPEFASSLKGTYKAVDILYNICGQPIKLLWNNNDLVGEESFQRALQISVDLGIYQDDQSNTQLVSDKEKKIRSMTIGTFSDFAALSNGNDHIDYIGLPTIGGTMHPLEARGLTAISASSEYKEECFRFLEYLFSYESQRAAMVNMAFPMTDSVYDEYMMYMKDPELIPDEDYGMKLIASGLLRVNKTENGYETSYEHASQSVLNSLEETIDSLDSVSFTRFGVYNILADELNGYYSQNKPVSEISKSLRSRLALYMRENS